MSQGLRILGVGRVGPVVAAGLIAAVACAGCGNPQVPSAIGSKTGQSSSSVSLTSATQSRSSATSGAVRNILARMTRVYIGVDGTGWGFVGDTLWVTTNNGAAWMNVTPLNLPSGTAMSSAFFVNARTGWVSYTEGIGSGTNCGVLRTTNGGHTWAATKVGVSGSTVFTSGYLDFVNSSDGWLTAVVSGAMGADQSVLYHTSDGGAEWADISVTSGLPSGGLGTENGVVFLNGTDGWWVGGTLFKGPIGLYHSTDGGKTWAFQELPTPSGLSLTQVENNGVQVNAPRFFGDGDGVLTLTTATGVAIYSTTNGGATWDATITLPGESNAPQFVSLSTAWRVDTSGAGVQITHDGGKTWSAIEMPAGYSGGEFYMQGVQAAVILGEGNTLWRTADGGKTWTAITAIVREP